MAEEEARERKEKEEEEAERLEAAKMDKPDKDHKKATAELSKVSAALEHNMQRFAGGLQATIADWATKETRRAETQVEDIRKERTTDPQKPSSRAGGGGLW